MRAQDRIRFVQPIDGAPCFATATIVEITQHGDAIVQLDTIDALPMVVLSEDFDGLEIIS